MYKICIKGVYLYNKTKKQHYDKATINRQCNCEKF